MLIIKISKKFYVYNHQLKNNTLYFTTCIFTTSLLVDRITGLDFASRSEVIATNGMAATSHPLATQTTISILNGGNAIDAAIAANAITGLVEPTGCGIGRFICNCVGRR